MESSLSPSGITGSVPRKRDFTGEFKQMPGREAEPALGRRISDSQLSRSKQTNRESNNIDEKEPFATVNTADALEGPETPAKRTGTTANLKSDSPRKKSGKNVVDSFSDEDDVMDLDEGDIALNEEKFERKKMSLEAKKFDISTRYYRGSTPLENLSRLGRLSLEDPTAFFPKRAPTSTSTSTAVAAERELTDSEAIAVEEAPAEGEEAERTKGNEPVVVDRISPTPVPSPQLLTLPFLTREPLTPKSDWEIFQNNKARLNIFRDVVNEQLKSQISERSLEDADLCREYVDWYIPWRRQFQELDRHREKEEQNEQESTETIGAPFQEPQMSPTATSATESRRKRAFGSEYDTERAIQLSLETEREAQAKREREAEQAQPDYDKEAVIPDLRPDSELENNQEFEDKTGLRDSSHALAFYHLQPTDDTFDKQEHDVFSQNFKEYPKKFGKIAQGLKGRSYKDCIVHYYATKWSGQYKPPKDKRRKVRGPRMRTASSIQGRPKANALISNLGDLRPDLYDGEESKAPVVAVTDSGRPKRAAAPTLFRERESDEQVPANATTGKKPKNEASGDQGIEKTPRKRPIGANQRPKRTKTQIGGTRQKSASPEKAELYSQQLGLDGQVEPDFKPTELGLANGLAQLQAGQGLASHNAVGNQRFMPPELSDQPPTNIEPIKANRISSYWSVPEVNQFPQLLEHFGTDWQSIANHMQTKTVTMVSTSCTGRLLQTLFGTFRALSVVKNRKSFNANVAQGQKLLRACQEQ